MNQLKKKDNGEEKKKQEFSPKTKNVIIKEWNSMMKFEKKMGIVALLVVVVVCLWMLVVDEIIGVLW
jgi:cell division protein FtsL